MLRNRTEMAKYTVQRGDYLQRIAKLHGLPDWRLIYDHPENATFRELRPNPNLIVAGDEVFVPEVESKVIEIDTGKEHRIRVASPTIVLRIAVTVSPRAERLTGVPYTLEAGGQKFEATVPDSGIIEHQVPSSAEEAVLRVTHEPDSEPIEYKLRVVGIPPASHISGQQLRLHNLGYHIGEITSSDNPRFRFALTRFQRDHELIPDGEAGPITIQKLEEAFGS